MRAEVWEDMGVGENGVKVQVVWKYSLTHPKINCEKDIDELENHVGRKH